MTVLARRARLPQRGLDPASCSRRSPALDASLDGELEVVFVVDGSPDAARTSARCAASRAGFASKLLLHVAQLRLVRRDTHRPRRRDRGEFFAVMAADLQEPPELIARVLPHARDATMPMSSSARAASARDPFPTRLASTLFWGSYRAVRAARDAAGRRRRLRLQSRRSATSCWRSTKSNSSLVGQLFWLGFRRARFRTIGARASTVRSAWTLATKLTYFFDSVFAFSDLPIRLLIAARRAWARRRHHRRRRSS